MYKAAQLLFIAALVLSVTAHSDERKLEILSGRVLAEENGKKYIHVEKDGASQKFLVHLDFAMFSGQQVVWAEGEVQNDYLALQELVTEKNVLIQGHVGQGVHLKGSLKLNSSGSYEFYPTNTEALKHLGGKRSFKVQPPADSISPLSPAYSANIRGVITGDTLHLATDTYAFHVVQNRARAKAGDTVVVTAKIHDNDSYRSYDFRNHGRADNYGFFSSRDIGEWVVYNIYEVHIVDSETGEWIPAELKSYDKTYASLIADSKKEVEIYPTEPGGEGTMFHLLGQLQYDDLLIISDAKIFGEGAPLPAITKDLPKVKTVDATVTKPRVGLQLLQGGLRDSDCQRSLTGKPTFSIVPRN